MAIDDGYEDDLRSDAEMSGDFSCDLCGGEMLSDHQACIRCGAYLHCKTSTAVEFAHGLCRNCIPPEERDLIYLLRDCSAFLTVLCRAGNQDPATHERFAALLSRLAEAGVDGGEILRSVPYPPPSETNRAVPGGAAPSLEES